MQWKETMLDIRQNGWTSPEISPESTLEPSSLSDPTTSHLTPGAHRGQLPGSSSRSSFLPISLASRRGGDRKKPATLKEGLFGPKRKQKGRKSPALDWINGSEITPKV